MGAEFGKEFGAQNPLSQGFVNERASSRLADTADVEPYDPRQELGAAELRILYRRESQAKRRADARPGLWMAVVIYVLFSVSDLLLIPDVAAYTITARFAVGLTALLVLEAQLRRGIATDWLDVTCAAAIIFGYIGWLCPAFMGENKESVAYYMVFGTIFMMSANLFFTFSFKVSIITSTIILFILYVVNYFLPATLTYKMVFGTFYVSCFTFTSYVNWKLNEERYNVFLNALEASHFLADNMERGKALLETLADGSAYGPGKPTRHRREAARLLERLAKAWQQVRGDPHRCRLLQEVQRLLRPSGGRPLPDPCRQCAERSDQELQWLDRALRRRRVHRARPHGQEGTGHRAGGSHLPHCGEPGDHP